MNEPTTEKTEVKTSAVTIPSGFPDQVFEKIQKGLKATPPRSVVFENEKQRNASFIQKGLTKPGKISYDTLRRAAMSVHVARICINTMKEKVTKTKWVIQPIDQLKRKNHNDARVKELMDFFKHPNKNNETFRTLLDKMLEDLLVLDAVSLEKTRYPDGKLAELFFVDSATIRPVYDDHGNQDIPIPLKTENLGVTELPVSYVQVLNNSQYGGPESGDIIAAWPKRDMIHFNMHPQGSMEGFGYGLSPLEGVLSVVANLLNADNFNSTYFEEGAFPPIILQLVGQINQRDLEAYREYMIQELTGNFHRPAIMAGEQKAEVINLKDMTNRDMQFMEYTQFLARLLAAAYGMSGQDIGLTDEVGSKNVAETQKDLSEGKGYSSVLMLIKEIFNQEIIWKDFGYEDLEFDWVAPDTTAPDVASQIYDRNLKNGTLTLNEVRQKLGETPYEEWADQPMILTADGYKPLLVEDQVKDEVEEEEDGDYNEGEVGGEKPYNEQDDVEGEETTKSIAKTLYICRPIVNAEEIIAWAKSQGFHTTMPPKEMHVTIAYSKTPISWTRVGLETNKITVVDGKRTVEPLGDAGAVVLKFSCAELTQRWSEICEAGGTWDYPSYQAHITLTYNGVGTDLALVKPFTGKIVLGPEERAPIQEGWMNGITEKSMSKSILTMGGYKAWADDRGYSQPFIFWNIKNGGGKVIKPPVAVNLLSQEMEIGLTRQLASLGLNVLPVEKMTLLEVMDYLATAPDVRMEFENYINMTPGYDSEKWRAKFGGSRKFPYYLVSDYVEGFPLNSPFLMADMKRDPEAYRVAIEDLAALWRAEKNLILGDRRADQYIIDRNKRAFGIDYQFRGDAGRWEKTRNAIRDELNQVPELLKLFEELLNKQDETMKSKIKKWFGRV